MLNTKILLTGSNGFIGHAIAKLLAAKNFDLVAPVRDGVKTEIGKHLNNQVNTLHNISAETSWSHFLRGVEVVVHCAGIVEPPSVYNRNKMNLLRDVNLYGTINLARQAASSGVRQFVFISTVKVNGILTEPGTAFRYDDIPKPADAYGLSKFDAELGLLELSDETGMDVTIIRPPIVYGPDVRGNFASLLKLVQYGVPLPVSRVSNKRSFIGIDNLVDLVLTCIKHPNAANQIFMASDGHDLSLPELLDKLALAMGKPSRLFPFSPKLLASVARLFGGEVLEASLFKSLQVDITRTRSELGWFPPVKIDDGLTRYFKTQKV